MEQVVYSLTIDDIVQRVYEKVLLLALPNIQTAEGRQEAAKIWTIIVLSSLGEVLKEELNEED